MHVFIRKNMFIMIRRKLTRYWKRFGKWHADRAEALWGSHGML